MTFILYLLNKSYPFSQLYWLYEYPPWKCRVIPRHTVIRDIQSLATRLFILFFTRLFRKIVHEDNPTTRTTTHTIQYNTKDVRPIQYKTYLTMITKVVKYQYYSALAHNLVRRQLFFYFCRDFHPYFVPVGLKKPTIRCNVSGVTGNCPVTCKQGCECCATVEPFNYKKKSRNCEWVGRKVKGAE